MDYCRGYRQSVCLAKETLLGQYILFDIISKEVKKIKIKISNNFQKKGQTSLDCLMHFETRSGPSHIHIFHAEIGRNIFASGHVVYHQPAYPPDTKVRYGGVRESKNLGNFINQMIQVMISEAWIDLCLHSLQSLCLQPACLHYKAIALLFDLIHIFVMHFLKDLHSTKSTFLGHKQDQQL